MQKSSQILIRTQSALRILTSLNEPQQQKFTVVSAELTLIERILAVLEPELFESAILEVLEDTLQSALEAIGGLIPEKEEGFQLEELLTQIAREYLSIETLEERKSDSLDFHDGVSIWSIKDALTAAYEAGKIANSEEDPS